MNRELRIKQLKSKHKELDEKVKLLYNTTYSENKLKKLKQHKLKLKDEIIRIQGECNGKEN
tara:strand:+ start:1372 stop:1554 length:183 start_codon:yes stop_codon:yes gene_type:complete